jgi:hypothetical protein
MAYNFQIGKNEIKRLMEYESVTQKVAIISNTTFLVTFSYSVSSFILFFPV